MNTSQLQDQAIKQFLADFQRELKNYPRVEVKDDVPLTELVVRKPSLATARRDPMNPMYFALKRANLL